MNYRCIQIYSHITIIYKEMLQVANEIVTLYQALM